MCHHYDSETLAHWERESTTEDEEPSDEEPEMDDEREDREPATPPADD